MQSQTIHQRIASPLTSLLTAVIGLWVIAYAFRPSIMPQQQHANVVLGVCIATYYCSLLANDSSDTGDTVQDSDSEALSNGGRTSMRASAGSAIEAALGRMNPFLFAIFAVLALVSMVYVHFAYDRWLEQGRLLIYTDLDLVVGGFLILVVIDVTFREYGRALGLVIVGTVFYALFGNFFPGFLQHSGMTVEQLIVRQTVTLSGLYGFLVQVGATWIAIFIIFAGLVQGHGGFEYILELGSRMAERSKSMLAQSAVLTSMIMGTMLGSSAANVATTGSFTIPLMKENDIPPRTSASIEALASTGGQILPPIMGTGAFIMADILGIRYATIALGGVIPAALFYVAIVLSFHLKFTKEGILEEGEEEGGPTSETIFTKDFALRGLQYALPLAALIYFLMIRQLGPLQAGIYTVAAILLTAGVAAAKNRTSLEYVRNTSRGLQTGGMNLAPFMGILASLGIVIDVIGYTGLTQTIATNMVSFAGGHFIPLLALAMITCLLFGLGMPTPAAYVLVAIIVGPPIVQMGVQDLNAHFFLFYFALLSTITPPVALSVVIASGIAKTNFIRTCVETLRLGAVLFLIPYVFVANQALVHWTFPLTAIQGVVAMAAIVAIVMTIINFNGVRALHVAERICFAAGGFVMAFYPSWPVQLALVSAFVFYLVIVSAGVPGRLQRRHMESG